MEANSSLSSHATPISGWSSNIAKSFERSAPVRVLARLENAHFRRACRQEARLITVEILLGSGEHK